VAIKKSKKNAWFKPVRRSYIPISWKGWLSYVPYVALLIGATYWELHVEKNFATALMVLFPFYVAVAVVMQWFASTKV
jgi:hypothetical protein